MIGVEHLIVINSYTVSTMLTEHYSTDAIQALQIAHAIARQNQHGYVDTEHVLAGIYECSNSLGQHILRGLISLSLAEMIVFINQQHQTDRTNIEKILFSPNLREALNWAENEARWQNCDYTGTEHLLLGLLKFPSDILDNLLKRVDVSAEQLRRRTQQMLHSGINEMSTNTNFKRDKLSELGKRVLRAAEQIADDYGSATLAPQHLLLALARERRSVVHQILPECGFDSVTLLNDLEQLPPRSFPSHAMVNHFLDKAVSRAEALGMHYTGTEHILLAMTLDPNGQELLAHYGVDNYYLQDYLHDTLNS